MWEIIDEQQIVLGETLKTLRLRVPFGWIVRTQNHYNLTSQLYAGSTTSNYIFDPFRQWVVK